MKDLIDFFVCFVTRELQSARVGLLGWFISMTQLVLAGKLIEEDE